MRLTTTGQAKNFTESIVGRIATCDRPITSRLEYIRFIGKGVEKLDCRGYRAVIASGNHDCLLPTVEKIRDSLMLNEEDVVVVEPNGFVRSLYRPLETHHTLFVTERCSSNCLMCSQPPKDVDDIPSLFVRNRELLRLMNPKPAYLTITGGEPTLLGDRLYELLDEAKAVMPATELHVLSNGRALAWPDVCQRIATLEHPRISFGIPLYSDFAGDHDYVVQARGAFDQTISGLHQAARNALRLEVRIVLHKLTIPRLHRLAEYIYRNLPFVEHIAFMGLEIVGYTARNIDDLWIDPFDYQEELEQAVEFLVMRGMNVSIYNHQLCVLRESLWPFAKKSISDWKNLYLPECLACSALDRCGGLFQWAVKKHSMFIRSV